MRVPTLNGTDRVTVYRRMDAVDDEGTPVDAWSQTAEFIGAYGTSNATRKMVAGAAGQQVDAAITTRTHPDVQVGDKVLVNADPTEWLVLGVIDTPVTRRILLARWGAR